MQQVADAELIVGLVGRIGVDTKAVCEWISEVLHMLRYDSERIKVTDFLQTKDFEGIRLDQSTVEDRYKTFIDACNKVREKAARNDFFASVAIQGIIEKRRSLGSEDSPKPRTAYIIDQIKRPEEADSLRKVYGKQFILISCHIPHNVRMETLSRKIAEGHASAPKSKEWLAAAGELIERDDKESSKPFGQRVSDVFPKADLIIDATNEASARPTLERFFEALFGNFAVSPSRDEFFQNLASNVALTSCDTARQVGAVIAHNGEIVTTGFNEAPKALGGTYWAGDGSDGRDMARGKDVNTVRKRQMVADIVKRLRDAELLKDNDVLDSDIEERFLDGKDAPLVKSQIMDTLEYGRAVHAEMAALSAASRLGAAVESAVLYCTTFPCHNCSKHIVASGISKVIYLEPYGKSFADELYPDSISVDNSGEGEKCVSFHQFIGITPNRYRQLFAKEKLKDEKGSVIPWQRDGSQPVFETLDQGHIDREILFQKHLADSLTDDQGIYLGLFRKG
ncbi:MAG: anti-phage dCTP deaminase [Pseudomonadota bacterium]